MKLRNVAGFAVGPIGAALLGLATVPVVAWIFAPADVGRLNVFQVTMSFALLLTVLGLDQAYVREFHEAPDRARLLRSCFAPGFLCLIFIGAATLPFASTLSLALYGLADGRLYLFTLLACVVGYVSRFLSLILRMQERGWAYSASQVLPKLLALALIGGVAVLGIETNFHLLQGVMVAAVVMVMAIYAWNTRHELVVAAHARVQRGQVRRLLGFGFPLVFSGLAYWGLTATSTIALRHWSTLGELAIYSVTSSFAGAAVIFQSIFATVWAPTVYRWVAKGVDMNKVDDVARHALLIACLIFISVGLLSWMVALVLPPHYAEVQHLLALAVAPSLLYTLSEITNVGIGISRRTGWTVWIALGALAVNVGLSWWLVPRHGAVGAVLANGCAYFVFFVLRTEVSAFLWRQFPRRKLYAFLGLMVSISSGLALVHRDLPPQYPLIWLIVAVLVLVSFRREVRGMAATVFAHWSGLRARGSSD